MPNKIIYKELSKAQNNVVRQIKSGSVIGELSDKFNGRYELFTRKPNWFPKTCHPCEHPFVVKRISKNTVFALLTASLIHKKDVAEAMWPFSRDVWYVFKAK
jgi:hypothetical protein